MAGNEIDDLHDELDEERAQKAQIGKPQTGENPDFN